MEEENKNKGGEDLKSKNSVKKILIALLVLLILLGVFLIGSRILGIGKGYSIYEGEWGKYRIDEVQASKNLTQYRIHVNVNDKHNVYIFRNHPKDLEDIYLEPGLRNKLMQKDWVYVTQDKEELGSDSLIGKIEFIQILGKKKDKGALYNLNVQSAFTSVVNGQEVELKDIDSNESILVNVGSESKEIFVGKTENVNGLEIYNFNINGTKAIIVINHRRYILEGGDRVNVGIAPKVTCEDANENIGVIYLDLGEENKVYSKGNCIILEGINDKGLLLASEKFAYHLIGVF